MKAIKLKIIDWGDRKISDSKKGFYDFYLIKMLQKHYKVVYSDNPDYIIWSIWI